jgi:bifunctional non-homologous end joining protein LigD
VLLWDRGTWEPQGDAHKDFAAGNLKFILKGEKLQGGFALVKIRGRGPRREDDDRAWLLIKERDAETREEAAGTITDERPESVTTQRTLEEIAADRGNVWHSNRDPLDVASAPGARDAPMPKALRPPQPARRKQPVEGDGWLHEIAVDGQRLLARIAGRTLRLLDGNGKALPAAAARQRQAAADAVRLLPAQTLIVDGFLAAVGPDGRADPTALPDALAGRGPTRLTYYLFDLPYLDGHDLRAVPLVRRKALLRELVRKVAERTCLRDLEHVTGSGAEFQRAARGLGIPFMLSRPADSRYDAQAGWVTVPCAETPPKTAPAKRRRVSGKA